jgi:hypothetical protein
MLSKLIRLLSFLFSKLNYLQVPPNMLPLLFETNAVLQTRNETVGLKIYLKTLYRCRVFWIDVAVRKLAETLQIFKDVSCNK